MRTRKEIEQSGTRLDILTLEVLLDIRDLFTWDKPKEEIGDTECDICGKVCKGNFGLMAHKRSHK